MSLLAPKGKIAVIDRETYQIQKNSLFQNEPKCYNLKYGKNLQSSFNLLHFISHKQLVNKKHHKRQINKTNLKFFEKRFKTSKRRKKKPSKLKKNILQYRRKKLLEISSDINVEVPTQLLSNLAIEEIQKPQSLNCYSRNFREYCDNFTTPELKQLTDKILRELDHFQKRAISQNPIKGRSHRRLCIGFREVRSYLRINKVKLVIIAPDCEKCNGDEGLDETINAIKAQCIEQKVLYMFALKRRELAYTLFKKAPISCVGILNYDGSQDLYLQLVKALEEAKKCFYLKLTQQIMTNKHK